MLLPLRLALHTLAGWRVRSLLLALAVLMASSLVMAIASAMESVQVHANDRLNKAFGAVNARIVHEFSGRFDDAWVARARQWPEVETAAGRLFATLLISRSDGWVDPETNEPVRLTVAARGLDPDVDERFHQIDITEGSRPRGPGEVAVDPITRKKLGLSVGDKLQIERFGDPIELKVVGFYGRPVMNFLQQAGLQMDRRTLAEATGQEGMVSTVSIIVKKGIDPAAFSAAHAKEVPPPLAVEPAEMARAGLDRQIFANRVAFIVATTLGFLSCCFIVATGMTTSVTEQQRLLAILRCIGGRRRDLFLSQLWLGILLCSAGGLLGLPVGLGLAWVLLQNVRELAEIHLVVSPLGLGLALGGAIVSGLIGAAYPAWQASRISPLAAMTIQARAPRPQSMFMCILAGAGCLAIQIGLALIPNDDARFWVYAFGGMPLLFVGYFLLSAPILRGVVGVSGRIVARLMGLPVALLVETMRATPFRHGFTAGSLMVGMAILVNVWSNATSLLDDWFNRIKFADGFVGRFNGMSRSEAQAVADLPFVTATCPMGYLSIKVIGKQMLGVAGMTPDRVICVGIDPKTFFEINRIEWTAGDPDTGMKALADGSGVLVAEQFLKARSIRVGESLTLGGSRTNHTFTVVGGIDCPGLAIAAQTFGIRDQYMQNATNCVFLDLRSVAAAFDNDTVNFIQVNLDPEVNDDAVAKAMSKAAPGARFVSGRSIRGFVNEVGRALLGVWSGVAFSALILACFGVGNIILAGIHGRRFEYGVLRAVGASPGLLARLVMAEAILIGLGGGAVGFTLGMHLAWMGVGFYRDLAGLPLRLAVPIEPAVIGLIVMLAMCLLAALPGIIYLVRQPTRALLAIGRAG